MLAARYGKGPWELEHYPMYVLIRWFDAALVNMTTEAAILAKTILGGSDKKTRMR